MTRPAVDRPATIAPVSRARRPLVRRIGTVVVVGWAAAASSILALDAVGGPAPRSASAAMEQQLRQLAAERDTRAADLSYGRKRVLEIATTLALDPQVLLLDEPMAGMGQEDVRMVAEIIRDVAQSRAVLMVEHNLKVVADLCHQVTVLQRGEILTSGDYRTVSQDERVRVAYMGTDDD